VSSRFHSPTKDGPGKTGEVITGSSGRADPSRVARHPRLALQYGRASRPRVAILGSLSNGSHLTDEILASWEDPRFALTLFRPTHLSTFGLVVTDRRLDGLARHATDEASRLDAQEAPQRDKDRRLAQAEDERVRLAKARQTNKGTFRP
jgi:hypothetical protein